MDIPRTFPLAGNTWTVRYKKKQELKGDYGACLEDKNEVWIQRGLKADKRTQTFIHELLHAIHYTMGQLDDHDEKGIEAMSQLLYQALFNDD